MSAVVNNRAALLTNDENEKIFNMLGKRCVTLATAVAQLVVALPESRDQWTKKTTSGVACFVKDNAKRFYFIRIYDLMDSSLAWEQQITREFKYNIDSAYFHSFAADTCNVGLNFADEDEALYFKEKLEEKLGGMHKRRDGPRPHQPPSPPFRGSAPPPDPPPGRMGIGTVSPPPGGIEAVTKEMEEESMQGSGGGGGMPNSPSQTSLSSVGNNVSLARKTSKDKNKNKKGKPKLSKEHIGTPENVEHGHIGWDPQGGFDVNVEMDEDWKKLFSIIGVTEGQMKEEKTRDFISDFVQQRGGIAAVTKEIEEESRPMSGPPPPPSRGLPPPPARGGPPPPSRGSAPPPSPPYPARMGMGPPPRGGIKSVTKEMEEESMQGSDWKKLYSIIGITESQMKEKKTRDFIYDFVQQRGGIEAVAKEMEELYIRPMSVPPPPPWRGLPRSPLARGAPPPPFRGSAPPPPPPSFRGSAPPPPPPPFRGSAPPPPPPAKMSMGAPPRGGIEAVTKEIDEESRAKSVTIATAPAFPDEEDIMPAYCMDKRPRGIALIFSNKNFPGKVELPDRLGTEKDVENLTLLWEKLHFIVIVKENLTAHEMYDTVRDSSRLDHSQYDCFVCCIMSHGVQGSIYGSDGNLIEIREITSQFKGTACRSLCNKPKLFFVQACRGRDFDVGTQPDAVLISDEEAMRHSAEPNEGHFLLGYATPPGYVSWRNTEQGSWYISHLCDVFADLCERYDVMSMMVKVNDKVSDAYTENGYYKQCPAPVVTLRKRIYFNNN